MSNNVGTGFSQSATGSSGFTTGSLGSLLALVSGIGYPYNGSGPKLGGGLPGLMPQSVVTHDNSNAFSLQRMMIREAVNTTSKTGANNSKRIIGAFRAVNNAGDLLCRQDYSCGGPCQTPQSRPGVYGLKNSFGSTSVSCRPSVLWSANQVDPNVPSSTCNGKYVYDSSNYTAYLRNSAMLKNYNDRSFGGNDYNASQSAVRHIMRY
jgi:hypothetical protein